MIVPFMYRTMCAVFQDPTKVLPCTIDLHTHSKTTKSEQRPKHFERFMNVNKQFKFPSSDQNHPVIQELQGKKENVP